MAIIYLPMCLDYIHIGHINILETALKYKKPQDTLIIGLVSDERMDYKPQRHHSYSERWQLASALKGVDHVTKEEGDPLFLDTIAVLRPKIVVHGNDWAHPNAHLYHVRLMIKELLADWGGRLIEPKYTDGVSSTCIRNEQAP